MSPEATDYWDEDEEEYTIELEPGENKDDT